MLVPMQQEEQVHGPKIMPLSRPLDENDMSLIKRCHNHFSFEQLCSDEDSHHESFICGWENSRNVLKNSFYIDGFTLLQLHTSASMKVWHPLAFPLRTDPTTSMWFDL